MKYEAEDVMELQIPWGKKSAGGGSGTPEMKVGRQGGRRRKE